MAVPFLWTSGQPTQRKKIHSAVCKTIRDAVSMLDPVKVKMPCTYYCALSVSVSQNVQTYITRHGGRPWHICITLRLA